MNEVDEAHRVMNKLSAILDEVNVVLKGEPPEGVLHSFHDIPKLVQELKAKTIRQAPCKYQCEAQAFKIEIRNLKTQIKQLENTE